MKKIGIFLVGIIIIIVAVFAGVKLYKFNNKVDNTNKNMNTINENVVNQVNYSVKNDITIKTSMSEEKVSPNATLILKRKYKECGHTIKEYKEVPETIVNLTKDEVEEKYKEWEMEKFTPLDIILIKEEAGVCDEHYILKEKDGLIAVYKVDINGKESLEELTGVSIEYLTENDKMKLEQGIKVYGKEELNSILEDYE